MAYDAEPAELLGGGRLRLGPPLLGLPLLDLPRAPELALEKLVITKAPE